MADPLTPIHAITLIKTLTFSSRVCHLFTETTHKTLLSDGEARRRQTEVSASDDRCFPLLTRRLHRERRRPASKEARITTSAKTAADPQETNLAQSPQQPAHRPSPASSSLHTQSSRTDPNTTSHMLVRYFNSKYPQAQLDRGDDCRGVWLRTTSDGNAKETGIADAF
ncbi:hypothetical protein BLNAU_20014 [Blattamonas nauphoetae]|uniref:Uncharacterized protein n=1 Tax=Blattamonas nauphoetae TaxID=2049346 RepID=A0ABQ9X144_9EUKA|nr:hypothetical protein BLNAU_20014 [Blattamonas nauphoetae]